MNYVAFTKALKFACLPTLSLLTLLFFGFFSITKTIEFIASDNGWAILLRIVAFLAEVGLVFSMYEQYKTQEILSDGNTVMNKRTVDSYKELRKLKDSWDSYDNFDIYDTEDPNTIYIKRTPYNKK